MGKHWCSKSTKKNPNLPELLSSIFVCPAIGNVIGLWLAVTTVASFLMVWLPASVAPLAQIRHCSLIISGKKVAAVSLGVNSWSVQILQTQKLRQRCWFFILNCSSQPVGLWLCCLQNWIKVLVLNDLSLCLLHFCYSGSTTSTGTGIDTSPVLAPKYSH